MSTEWDIPKNKFASGLLCGAVASGVVAAASLGGVGTANATCVSFSGFSLGTGCTSSLGGFAIGIGDGKEDFQTELMVEGKARQGLIASVRHHVLSAPRTPGGVCLRLRRGPIAPIGRG